MWLLLLCTSFFGAWLFRRHRQMTLLRRLGFKGPKPNFILGSLVDLRDVSKAIGKWTEEYGDIVAFYIGGIPALMVMDATLLKAIQIKNFHVFADRLVPKRTAHVDKTMASNILYIEKSRWRDIRRLLTPAFSASKLKLMTDSINEAIKEMIDELREVSANGSKEVDIYQFYKGLTMDVIGRTAFGTGFGTQKSDQSPIIEHALLALEVNLFEILDMFFPELNVIIYPFRVAWWRVVEFFGPGPHSYLYSVIREVLLQRRLDKTVRKDVLQAMIGTKMENGQIVRTQRPVLTADSKEKVDIANANSSKKHTTMNDDEITGSAFVFLEAGFETLSSALAFVTHVLVNHPEVQEKVRVEVQELMSKEGKFDYDSMAKLPYTEAVILETLRIYPPAPYLVHRQSCEDYVHDGRLIPKGTTILVPVAQLHRKPDYWPEPDKFDPMRFYKENKVTIDPVHYQAFGAGPRNCIGMRFAILEAKLALVHLLSNFRLELGPSTEIGDLQLKRASYFLRPLNSVKVKLSLLNCSPELV